MKATGIVRRIDDLGRVVIPKEIRRTLRLREGTPLEIFTDREGEIILKKYSPMVELTAFSGQYAEAMAQSTGLLVCITDRDQVIAVSGGAKKELLQKNISRQLEADQRQNRQRRHPGGQGVHPAGGRGSRGDHGPGDRAHHLRGGRNRLRGDSEPRTARQVRRHGNEAGRHRRRLFRPPDGELTGRTGRAGRRQSPVPGRLLPARPQNSCG